MELVRQGTYFANQGWYPDDARGCTAAIDRFLAQTATTPVAGADRGGIVPHAGWTFSGALACEVFATLAASTSDVEALVLLGGHLGPQHRGWVLTSGAWPTPLGELEVDSSLGRAIAEQTGLPAITPAAYSPDNTIELQLPFVVRFFPGCRIVAAGIPAYDRCDAVGRQVRAAIEALGRRALVIGSTDLTHYGPNYGFSPRGGGAEAVRWVKEENDRRATQLMEGLQSEILVREALDQHFCCCPGAAAAALAAGRAAGATSAHLLRSLTSYDVRPSSSFVGYAALVF